MTIGDRDSFTARVLFSLASDLADFQEMFERIQVQIAALANEHDVPMASAAICTWMRSNIS